MTETFDRYLELIETRLQTLFTGLPSPTLNQAMRYSLLAGGKRIRPVLLLAFCEASGGDPVRAARPACAVELLHTYSLIHDDLPCMDDDALRRGQPTNHIVYGEYTAVLAGDAMQAAAFGELLSSDYPADTLVTMGRILAEAAGIDGICGGQALEMQGQGRALTREDVSMIHRLKTASLLAAAAKLGVAAAGGDRYGAAAEYAGNLGLAFQIRDDMLDVLGAPELLGKPSGSDRTHGKATFMSLFGQAECERLIAACTESAIECVRAEFDAPEFLVWLAERLAGREY